ncbi:MAG: methyltransferase domain-containing protein [Acidobacteriota bacterium]|nr:methyltransferase domain-containing protein [Acidobacteriota bacterium]
MTPPDSVQERMRDEWNERAREDAHYFVAFGRREQDDEEFFATAADLVRELESELKRLPAGVPVASRRALEIGCGPGRLIRPMSRHFGEIHGIDVSDEMIARAGQKLAGIPHAHVHPASGSDLALFASDYFDFVYSYAVFQHIPSADVVFSYLRETARVLKPGGIARLQLNGLPKTSRAYTTWEGVRIGGDEIHAFTRERGIQLLSLTGIGSQYMGTTWRKPDACSIRGISNSLTSEQAVPSSGRLACAALTVANLPEGCDLNSLAAHIDGVPGTICYIGPQAHNALTQVNVFLPAGARTGLLPVQLFRNGSALGAERHVRVIPAGPAVPRLIALTDAVNLLSTQRIESGLMKAVIDEVDDIETFSANVDGTAVTNIDPFKTDPLAERWEVNFQLPAGVAGGAHALEVRLGKRLLTRTVIDVIALLVCCVGLFAAGTPEENLRALLKAKTGSIQLPGGTIEISREIVLQPSAHDLDIQGAADTVLKASPTFRGRALLVIPAGARIKIRTLTLDGTRDEIGRMAVVPAEGQLISRIVGNNGIVAEGVAGLEISGLNAAHVAGFAIVVGSSQNVRVHDIEVTESGGFDPQRRNNGAGGIVFEDAVSNFEITGSRFGGIRGNGITLRSVSHGRIADNEFNVLSRDAVQARHASALTIENNRARQIGAPTEELAGRAECMLLEDLNDSMVKSNHCEQTVLGAIVVTGSRNSIAYNRLLHLNLAQKTEAGIGLAGPATGNTIEGNEISGFGMNKHCVEVSPVLPKGANKVLKNDCSDEASVAGLRPATPH